MTIKRQKNRHMKVLNVHSRSINQPIEKIAPLLSSLATNKDKIWPLKKWPSMRFKDGFHEGSRGGHGPVKYFIKKLEPEHLIEFNLHHLKILLVFTD